MHRSIYPLLGLLVALSPACDEHGASDADRATCASGKCDDAAERPQPIELAPLDRELGDPELGEYLLKNELTVGCGIPRSVFYPRKFRVLGLPFFDGPPMPERAVGDYRSEFDDGSYDWVPNSWTWVADRETGRPVAQQNCLMCHGGEFNGEFIVGQPNVTEDFTVSWPTILDRLPVWDSAPDTLRPLFYFLSRTQGLEAGTQMKTIGTNPAELMVLSMMSHRDPETLQWSPEVQLDPEDARSLEHSIPSDVAPWWNVKKKNFFFSHARSFGDFGATMLLATSLCTEDREDAEAWSEAGPDIYAYLRTLEAPPYPEDWPLDADLAAEGEAVFSEHCEDCHGTYSDDPSLETYPNLFIPSELLGTDEARARLPEIVPWAVDWFYESAYHELAGEDDRPRPEVPGYVAPPLDGVFATAPYFHNGSVPTLRQVCRSEERPTYWVREDYDSTHYDHEELGWPYRALSYGHDEALSLTRPHRYRKERIYDTTQFGHGNGGHNYCDDLSDADLDAVLEYLKTI